MSRKILTLLIIHKDDQVLLGMKKRGFGMGKWNGFGGKVAEGESIEEAAKCELFEECEVSVESLEKMGVIDFSFASPKLLAKEGWKQNETASAQGSGVSKEILEVNIFKATQFSGQPQETEEMKPQWFNIDKIPFEKMWPDDIFWMPLFLANKKFKGKVVFDKDNKIVEHELKQLP